MSILVTGGAGYIGGQLVRHLCDAGAAPVVYDDLSTGSADTLPREATLIRGDVRDGTALRAAIAAHAIREVIHFAGAVSVEESVRRPALYYSNNTGATAVLMDACAESGVERLIFSSTAAVYGTPTGPQVSETDAVAPQSPYGHSKLLAEQIIQASAARAGVRYAILRYFNVAGADPQGRGGQTDPNAQHLIRNALRAARGELASFDVFGDDYDTIDGTGVRDFIHVADLADVHLRTLDYLRAGGDSAILNCGYGEGVSVLQVIEVVKQVTGFDFPVRHAPRRPGDVASVVADTSLARQKLAWTPRLNDLALMVEHAWRWASR